MGEVLVSRCRGSEEGAVGEGNMVNQEALESREEPQRVGESLVRVGAIVKDLAGEGQAEDIAAVA